MGISLLMHRARKLLAISVLAIAGLLPAACTSPARSDRPVTGDQQQRQFDSIRGGFHDPQRGGSPRQPGTDGRVNQT